MPTSPPQTPKPSAPRRAPAARRARQQSLALEPDESQVREAAQRLLCRTYWRRRYRSLEELQQQDPEAARQLWICARGAARAALRG